MVQVKSETVTPKGYSDLPPAWEQDNVLTIHDVIMNLYSLSKPICLWPYTYNRKNKIVQLNFGDKILASLLTVIVALFYCWYIFIVLHYSLGKKPICIILTYLIYNLFVNILAVISVIIANTKIGKQIEAFYIDFDMICGSKSTLDLTHIFPKLKKKILIQLLMLPVIGITLSIFDVLLYLSYKDCVLFVSCISIYLAQYILIIVYHQIVHKVELLYEAFKHLNGVFENFDINPKSFTTTDSERCNINRLKILCNTHGKLCNLIDRWNEAHGWQILLLVFAIVALVLNSFNIGLTYITFAMKWNEIILCVKQIVYMIFYCGIITVLSAKCTKTRKEVLKAGVIASEIISQMQLNDNQKCKEYVEQLQLLIMQISYKKPHFSAAEVFTIDYTTVSAIGSSITSYFIVLLQFKGDRSSSTGGNSTLSS